MGPVEVFSVNWTANLMTTIVSNKVSRRLPGEETHPIHPDAPSLQPPKTLDSGAVLAQFRNDGDAETRRNKVENCPMATGRRSRRGRRGREEPRPRLR